MKKVEYDVETLPPLTEAQRRELKKLLGRDEIDLDDHPELSDELLSRMTRGKFYRPIKQQITARLDADVLAWLKSGGKGYQSRMNAILRQAMLNAADN